MTSSPKSKNISSANAKSPRAVKTAGAAPVDYDQQREAAVFRFRFVADRLSLLTPALRSILSTNMRSVGIPDVEFGLDLVYSPYSPQGGGLGSLTVTLTAKWEDLASPTFFSFIELTKGLPVSQYSALNNGRRMREQTGPVCFNLELDNEETQPLMYVTALAQEKALSQALASMQASLQTAGVAKTLRGTGPDFEILTAEKSLQEEISELELNLEAKKEELVKRTESADKVRKKLRETEEPTVAALKHQVNDLRERIGKPLI